eukprot:symbB.v1.2.003197.t1/scaffold158.1/size292703/10
MAWHSWLLRGAGVRCCGLVVFLLHLCGASSSARKSERIYELGRSTFVLPRIHLKGAILLQPCFVCGCWSIIGRDDGQCGTIEVATNVRRSGNRGTRQTQKGTHHSL